MARPPSTQKLLVPLPEWWPEFEVPHKMFVPLPPAATYLEGHLARGDPLAWLCFRSAWVFNVAGRRITDILQRAIMWKLTSSLCRAIEELGLEFLCAGSKVTVSELSS